MVDGEDMGASVIALVTLSCFANPCPDSAVEIWTMLVADQGAPPGPLFLKRMPRTAFAVPM